eukprot:364115-Chlamydomonas_euryale.AAC.8
MRVWGCGAWVIAAACGCCACMLGTGRSMRTTCEWARVWGVYGMVDRCGMRLLCLYVGDDEMLYVDMNC